MDVNGGVVVRWAACEDEGVAQARRRVRAELGRLGVARAVVGEGELMVSELMTNAVRYGRAPIVLAVWASALGCVVVEVRDAGPGCPVLPSPLVVGEIDPDEEGGRGLPTVTAYSNGMCGARPLGGGKSVWFALPVRDVVLSASAVTALVEARHGPGLAASARDAVWGGGPMPLPDARVGGLCRGRGLVPV